MRHAVRAIAQRLSRGDRVVRIGTFPVGIETAELRPPGAARDRDRRSCARCVSSLSGRAMIIGVDRLDYSKGIALAHERVRALSRRPIRDWRGKVTYLQITPQEPLRDPGICRHGTRSR